MERDNSMQPPLTADIRGGISRVTVCGGAVAVFRKDKDPLYFMVTGAYRPDAHPLRVREHVDALSMLHLRAISLGTYWRMCKTEQKIYDSAKGIKERTEYERLKAKYEGSE
jgi:hypothetical protein